MTLVLSPVLPIQVNVGRFTIIVIAATLHVKLGVCAAVLDDIENMQTVVLVELEALGSNFVRARVITVIVIAILIPSATVFILSGGVLEEIEVEVFVVHNAFVE